MIKRTNLQHEFAALRDLGLEVADRRRFAASISRQQSLWWRLYRRVLQHPKRGNDYPNPPAQDRSVFKDPGYRHGLKPKDLVGIPWRAAFALQADGWWLRQDIIWAKPNPMPESVTDRCTKAHEYVFLLAKSARYYYDADAIREPDNATDHPRRVLSGQPALEPSGGIAAPHTGLRTPGGRNKSGRNRRSVWTIPTSPYAGAHFATFPPALIEPMILASCPPGGTVLDPFGGSGTTGHVASALGRKAILVELNPKYVRLAETRCAQEGFALGECTCE